MEHHYQGIVCYENYIIDDFYSLDIQFAIAKLSRLIEEQYPNAQGQVIDMSTSTIIYKCKRDAIC